ncbi:MAG TPA: SDR family NAD(P)-dependent oxidoreductase [Dehalococcoidales bacterium]|nr:SDR family NAD(P)-dependent oxidoreductase [Dehalococcoidales bacterium]
MELSKRTVLITGGTSGIGLGMAEAFKAANSHVIVCGRNNKKLRAIKEKFPEITAIPCDVGVAEQRKKLVAEILHSFPDLDIVVNNAGVQRYINLKKGYDELTTGEDEIAINFVAVVELTALFIKHLMAKPSSAIINVSSGLGFMPMPNTPIYNATKAAIHTYSLVLRQQLKNTSVKVIEIVPPMVDTELNKSGRDIARMKFRGISVSEYIPTIVKGLKNDEDTIFYGDGAKIMAEPRGLSESRLLNPSW